MLAVQSYTEGVTFGEEEQKILTFVAAQMAMAIERKRAEAELKSALQMKSDFVSFATHQLRTPLAGIKWSLELAAQEENLSEETASFIQDGRESAQRLIGMVNDLLDVSRLESGKLKLAPKETSLAELTQSVLKDVSHYIEKQGHHLSVSGMEGIPPVLVDPQLFRQVILNMVSNAIKYTPSGGKIDIRMGRENSFVRWAITDSGIGIPKASQARLFEKFYRAENVYKIETEGTGLGLHLVKLIVEKSGGRIWCESEENKGSTFQFTLPLGGGNGMSMNSKRVLLVEDDRFLRRACEKSLRQQGFNVSTAPDGEEALRAIHADPPDIILLDLLMPKVSGIEVLKDIKSDEKTRDIPVIILTNSSKETDIREIESLGVSGYLVKANLSLEELGNQVKQALEG